MRKIIIIGLIGLGIVAIGAIGGRKVYRQWKGQQALSHAKAAMAKSEYKQAGLWLKKALSADGGNIEALKLMGDLTDTLQIPEAAIYWRSRLLEREPILTNRLILARTALAYRDYATARRALDGVDLVERNVADYNKLTAALAVATGQLQEAESHFKAALKSDPENPIVRLNLGALLMQRLDPELAARGRGMLEELRSNSAVRTEAMRHLASEALQRTNYARALALATEVIGETNAVFADRLFQMDVLVASRNSQFAPTLAQLQQSTRTNAAQIFTLAHWMLRAASPAETLRWLETVSPEIRTNLPVAVAVADAFLTLSNWAGLKTHVDGHDWGEMEYLRLTYSSRALREQHLDNASKADWQRALKASESRLDRVFSMQRVVAGWRWYGELEDLLWITVNKYPAEKLAVQSLANLLFASGKTRSLLTLYAQEAKREPQNLVVKNNLAEVALLLGAPEHKPHDLARELYEVGNTNPVYVATYAYSLHLQNKTPEGIRVLSQLKSEELERPAVAGFYGVLLAANGDKPKAAKYLALSLQSPLLPEEKELFQRAKL